MNLEQRPLLTDIFEGLDSFVPRSESRYVYGSSPEERSLHSSAWEGRAKGVRFVAVTGQSSEEILCEEDGSSLQLALRSSRQLQGFLGRAERRLYLDITGLAHHVWAPLLRAGLAACDEVVVVYVELGDYRYSAAPTDGEIFDLSERISGIAPLPGFAALSDGREEDTCFVPLLGFEGVRFSYLLEQVQPPGAKIVPIIGVPGFRPEYPFHTYHGNRLPLLDTLAWKKVRFALANCPFSLFYLLEDIASEYSPGVLKIAPIGTKPHALGAVLYNLASARRVELVYDHPIRRAARTSGASRVLVYHVSSFKPSAAGL